MSGVAKPALAGACALLAACALPAVTQTAVAPPAEESPVPGTIGVVVQQAPDGVVVAAVREGVSALRTGDLVVRYNGAGVASVRDFNRMVVGSRPGSMAHVELLRGGERRRVQVPVRQLDTMPRG